MANPLTDALFISPGDFYDAGTGTDYFATVDALRYSINPAAAHTAFQSAHDALPASGGRIEVLPGTAVYTFTNAATFTKPVELVFHPGARIAINGGGSATSRCFLVRAPGCVFRNMQVYSDIDAGAGAGRAIVVLGNVSAHESIDFLLDGGSAKVAAAATAIERFNIVQAVGFDLGTRGLTIRDFALEYLNVKIATGTPSQQTNAWSGADFTTNPYGIGLLYADNYRAIEITGCSFRGDLHGVTNMYGGCTILLEDCERVQIHDNTWEGYSAVSSTKPEGLPLICNRSGTTEGGHIQIHHNNVHSLDARYFVATNDPRWVFVENNTVGKTGAEWLAVVYAINGEMVTVKNNETHNFNGYQNTETFASSSTALTGTNIHLGIANGDVIYASGFDGSGVNRRYTVTTSATDSLTVSPSPPAVAAGSGDETVRKHAYMLIADTVAGLAIVGNIHHLRDHNEWPYLLTDCKNVHRDAASEYIEETA